MSKCLWPRWVEPSAALFTLRSWLAEAGDLPRKRLLEWKCSFSRADQILITLPQQHGSVSSRKRSYLQIFTLQPVYLEALLWEEIMSRACVVTSFEPNAQWYGDKAITLHVNRSLSSCHLHFLSTFLACRPTVQELISVVCVSLDGRRVGGLIPAPGGWKPRGFTMFWWKWCQCLDDHICSTCPSLSDSNNIAHALVTLSLLSLVILTSFSLNCLLLMIEWTNTQ